MWKRAVVVLAVLSIADSARSQTIPQLQFRWQAIANPAPGFGNSAGNGFTVGSVLNSNINSPQSSGIFRQTFALQANVTSSPGVENAGLLGFKGDIRQSQAGLLAPGVGGTGRKGATAALGHGGVLRSDGIINIDTGQTFPVPGVISWPESAPAPLPPSNKPADFAANQFATVYQVTFQTSDLSPRTINLDFVLAPTDVYSVLERWVISKDMSTGLPYSPPLFPGDVDVSIAWFPQPISVHQLPNESRWQAGFSFTFIPAPSSAALLCVGGVVAFRRRR